MIRTPMVPLRIRCLLLGCLAVLGGAVAGSPARGQGFSRLRARSRGGPLAAYQRRLRTTNGLERLNKEIKRRTRVATLFPNEASLLRLASGVRSEISDDWETERAYPTMEAR
jgi:transposase-like protein